MLPSVQADHGSAPDATPESGWTYITPFFIRRATKTVITPKMAHSPRSGIKGSKLNMLVYVNDRRAVDIIHVVQDRLEGVLCIHSATGGSLSDC